MLEVVFWYRLSSALGDTVIIIIHIWLNEYFQNCSLSTVLIIIIIIIIINITRL